MNEHIGHSRHVLEHIIGAASYDHAFVGLAYLADDLKLSEEHLFIYRQRACIDPFAEIQCGSQIIGKAVFSVEFCVFHELPGKSAFFNGHIYYLFIVERYAQPFCKELSYDPAAAPIFTAYCYQLFHNYSSSMNAL